MLRRSGAATKVLGSPQGTPAFHRIVEIHFPSMDALQACAASEGGKQTIAHAVSISSGGAPTFLVAEEETFVFQEVEGAARKLGYRAAVRSQLGDRKPRANLL